MIALRSLLLVSSLDADGLTAAARSAADVVVIDLASAAVDGQRAAARTLAAKHARAIARTGRTVLVRVADTRSGEMEADLEAIVAETLTGVVLSGTEEPQDARDADVQIRRREMRIGMQPGHVRLVPEIDSAAGVRAAAAILHAIDRHAAVALDVDGLRRDMRLGDRAGQLYDHAMADIAMAARTAALPWLLLLEQRRPEWANLPARAHDFGAGGAGLHDEPSMRGMNSLFAPDATEVAIARAMLVEWERVRAEGRWTGVVAGELPEARAYDRLVDRRSVRAARDLIALAEAVAARERLR